MHICGLEKMSLVDFDGLVASTIFTGGCNFKCGFCHNSALVLNGQTLPTIPEEEILSYLQKRKGIIDGLCVSGGEPTLQKDLPLFIEKIKKLGYKVKLDTNGTNPDMIKLLFENSLIDFVAMDTNIPVLIPAPQAPQKPQAPPGTCFALLCISASAVCKSTSPPAFL